MSSAPKKLKQPKTRSADGIVAILFECAADAAVRAFLVLLMGSLALNLVGGIWRDMTPSLPPGFAGPLPSESASPWPDWFSALRAHRFFIVFAILFVVTAWTRLARQSNGKATTGRATWWQRFGSRLSEEWVGLIVSNAFGALVAVMLLAWMQQFSFSKVLFKWFIESFAAPFYDSASSVLGLGLVERIRAWLSWYGENQFKFNFWVLYLAAICDDLGIPNLKTLGRRIWRRRQKTGSKPGATPTVGSAP
jgi:hypothetical protein